MLVVPVVPVPIRWYRSLCLGDKRAPLASYRHIGSLSRLAWVSHGHGRNLGRIRLGE